MISRSDVPFVVLPDPLSVADSYRVGDFGIAIIGTDGNLDYATDRVITGQKIVDVVNNSYATQVERASRLGPGPFRAMTNNNDRYKLADA